MANHPIGNNLPPKDPYERYRAEPVQAEKKTEEEAGRRDEQPHESSSTLGAYLLFFAHNILSFILTLFNKKTEVKPLDQTSILKHLLAFKRELELLKESDQSQNPSFLNLLCDLWHAILEDSLSFNRNDPLTSLFKKFIKQLDSYPEAEEFSFGYYLTEYAGQKWLPFPYIELVQKLYAQHQRHPEASALTLWTHEIDSLLILLDPDLL